MLHKLKNIALFMSNKNINKYKVNNIVTYSTLNAKFLVWGYKYLIFK